LPTLKLGPTYYVVGIGALGQDLADESVVELSVLFASVLDSFDSPVYDARALFPSLP